MRRLPSLTLFPPAHARRNVVYRRRGDDDRAGGRVEQSEEINPEGHDCQRSPIPLAQSAVEERFKP